MINEIANFVDELRPEVFTKDRNLSEGLYLFIEVNSKGELLNVDSNGQLNSEDVILFNKGDEQKPIHHGLIKWEINSTPVSHHKTFDSVKKIFTKVCSPYAIGFKKSIFEKNINENSEDTRYGDIRSSIELYVKSASEYIEEETEIIKSFKAFCEYSLIEFITSLEEYQSLNKNTIVIILLKDVELEKQVEFHQRYLSEKVFNKEEYNKEVNGELFGISDSVSGFNRKKMFLKHQTAPLDLNYRVQGNHAMKLWKFFQLKKNKTIPNPFPLFVDKKELNQGVVSIFNEDRTRGYSEIVKHLIRDYDEDQLSNYYLILFQSGQKGSQIVDLDFVPTFKFKIKPSIKVEEVFPLGGKVKTEVKNVFQLERKIINRVFNGQLVQKTKKGNTWLKYFDDVEFNPNYFSSNGYNLFLKYRKPFYDYIYKSKQQAVTKRMFDEIMKNGILDDIRSDEMKEGSHTKGYQIKEKLNIWFSLYNFFEGTTNQTSIDMVNKTEVLYNKLKTMAPENSDERISNDDEFAFASGQVIYYLLNQSEASNRTHALLEPFLQKTDANLFKKSIAKTFDAYKHAIKFYRKKYAFDKVMADVMGFEPGEENMKNLMPLILAGYFSKSVFYSDKNDTSTNN